MKVLTRKNLAIACLFLLIATFSLVLSVGQIYATAGFLSTASIQMSDSRPSETGVTYKATFTPSGTTSLQCIKIVFATAADMTGGVPAALTTTAGVKGAFTGSLTAGDWTFYNPGNGTIQYESAGSATTAIATSIATTTITNTSAATFYAQITTYGAVTSHTCSTQVDQSNVMALATLAGVSATVTVQPTLTFGVVNFGSAVNTSGDTNPKTTTPTTIPFGIVAAGATSWGSQTLTVSTNAAHGYTLYVRDSQALTDTNSDTIRDQSGTQAAPASFDASTSQSSFAYTADGAGYSFGTAPAIWAGLTQTNAAIATRAGAYDTDTTHVEFKVGISNVQPPGTYSTVVAYTATPSY